MVPNFRVREARVIIIVVFCVREARKCRASSFARYLCLSVPPLATTRKIFGRVPFRVRLSLSLSFSLVLSRADLPWLCRDFVSWCLCVSRLFSAFCKVVRSFADTHVEFAERPQSSRISAIVASAIARAICDKYLYMAWARAVES